jgi:hypothetical protein
VHPLCLHQKFPYTVCFKPVHWRPFFASATIVESLPRTEIALIRATGQIYWQGKNRKVKLLYDLVPLIMRYCLNTGRAPVDTIYPVLVVYQLLFQGISCKNSLL